MSNQTTFANLFSTESKTSTNLLTRKEAALYLGVTESTLAVWACEKRYGLPYVKMGRLAKYRQADLDAFIKQRTITQQSI